MGSGAFRERFRGAVIEVRENPGRSILQALGVMLGVASVLGGFSITDSTRRRSDEVWRRLGGMDRLNVMQADVAKDGSALSALQMANHGLTKGDADGGASLAAKDVDGVMVQKFARARVRSSFVDRERDVTGIGVDYLALNGYSVAQGRGFSTREEETGAAVALLGAEAVQVFFPTGNAVGQTIRIGETPVTVVGVLQEKVFRFRNAQGNIFAWRNRLIAVPAGLIQRRFQGDDYRRVDRVTYRIRDLDVMQKFTGSLGAMLFSNHRQQKDYRLDDVAARIRKNRSQGDVYKLIFMLSGVLSLLGGGMVNVNIQMASLKERVREVGVKMAIGAPGREVFKEFMTEAFVLSGLGGGLGIVLGIVFSKVITSSLGIPLFMAGASFGWALFLAFFFGFGFALVPAWKASRLSPMEALRYE